jgi:hypothetical protein
MPPFTLDIPGVDDISQYCIEVDIAIDDAIISQDPVCISDPEYNFTQDYDSVCHIYSITVYATNLVGNGSESQKEVDQSQTSRLISY